MVLILWINFHDCLWNVVLLRICDFLTSIVNSNHSLQRINFCEDWFKTKEILRLFNSFRQFKIDLENNFNMYFSMLCFVI